ncbi:MAG: GNAT family N-acetyltransferase [Clostridia bacterium]|nr:GNAT family N-acetyltransferase [Clostridia bacterium]
MRIGTERLCITVLTQDMARDVHLNSLDEDTARFVPDEVFETEEAAREAIGFLTGRYASAEGPFVYAVTEKAGGRYIGYVQMVRIKDGAWEIGYQIGKAHRGRGLALEAVQAFLPAMAEAHGIREVFGICLAENKASRRVLEKCGFAKVFEGTGEYQGSSREIVKYLREI